MNIKADNPTTAAGRIRKADAIWIEFYPHAMYLYRTKNIVAADRIMRRLIAMTTALIPVQAVAEIW